MSNTQILFTSALVFVITADHLWVMVLKRRQRELEREVSSLRERVDRLDAGKEPKR
jgi:cytochrome c-type biogenesis protein CcmH/NrfF